MYRGIKGAKPRGAAALLRQRRGAAALLRQRDGTAAVEFALLLPVMTSMILGALEFSGIFFSYSAMQTAARDVTRQIAVNTMPQSEAEDAVRARVPGWMREAVQMELAQSAPGDPNSNVIEMRLLVPAHAATPLHFFTRSLDWELVTRVEMKQELPFDGDEA
jgi:Flp pilus assembly pilin Flp